MKISNKDFVEISFDLYANGSLVQTTDEKKGKVAGLDIKEYGNHKIIVGNEFILKALDADIVKNDQIGLRTLELDADNAYGKKDKNLIKVFPKSAFEEHKLRPVVGIVYDFNGMYGLVKSIVGGRVMVDFNNPLAGKDIKIEYAIIKKIEDIAQKIAIVMDVVFRLPKNLFTVKVSDKNITLALPEQLKAIGSQITKGLEEFIPEIKDYSIGIEKFKKQ